MHRSAKKKTTPKKQALHQLYEAAFDNIPVGVVVFSADGQSIMANKTVSDMSGTPHDVILSKNIKQVPAWKKAGLTDAALKAIESGKAVAFDTELTTLAGKIVYATGSFVPITINDKRLVMFIASDTSELRKAHGTAKFYRSALDQLAAVCFTDKAGIIIHINDVFCNLSGYTKKELLGQDQRILNSGYHSKSFSVDMWNTIASGVPWRGEICNRNKSGNLFWLDTSIIPQVDEKGNIEQYISVQFDISKKKNGEQQLIHSAKMTSLGEMAGGIAHEINNPLTIIRAYTEQIQMLLETNPVDPAKIQTLTQTIVKAVDRAAKIITGLRAFARDGSNDPFREVKVTNLINNTLDFCRSRFVHRGIQIKTEAIDPDLVVQCREEQLSQVILNLLFNAFDAIEGTPNAFVEITSALTLKDTIEISVKDSGNGIPTDIAKKIMQPFFTTKEIGKGTGLGLSVSMGIMESHHGKLMLDQECQNTRFILKLPSRQPKSILKPK